MQARSRLNALGYVLVSATLLVFGFAAPTAEVGASSVDVWWPTNGAHVTGVQPFKAMLSGLDVSQYEMFWQVDGGQWNSMSNNPTDYPHKEASVDLSGWNWHGSGPYKVNFIAQKNGVTLAQYAVTIYVDNGQQVKAPAPTPVAAPIIVAKKPAPLVSQSAPQVIANTSSFYVDPNTEAAKQEKAWEGSNPAGAKAMERLAATPVATWFGGWNSNVQSDVHAVVSAAKAKNQMPVLVAYNIPERDCGGFSAGGSNNPSGYAAWIQSFAAGIGSDPAMIILEPDALAQISCLSVADQSTRLKLLSDAISTFKAHAGTKVYLDAGHSGWVDAGTMASNLLQSNISKADGFSLNVSNFDSTSIESAYGKSISAKIGGKHFVVDTSRNGNGSTGEWCNPQGASIGASPTKSTGDSSIDAFLWIKTPGASDGNCNGGPSAGTWWPEYAQKLVSNVH